MPWSLYQGDALLCLAELPSQSVHTCITSPPYFGLRDYGVDGQIGLEETPAQYVERLVEVFEGVRRVLRDDGTLWIVIGDSYYGGGQSGSQAKQQGQRVKWGQKGGRERVRRGEPDPRHGLKFKDLIGIPWLLAFALRDAGWFLRQEIIWAKSISGELYRGGSCMPESVKDRCTRAHETVFLLSKNPKYYFDFEGLKERAVQAGRERADKFGGVKLGGDNVWHSDGSIFRGSDTRNRRSVWHVNPKPFKGAHFATFPPDLIKPMVLAGCPQGGTVLDPFAGAGTTGVVALEQGRSFVGIELNPEYVETLTRPRLKTTWAALRT